MTCAECEVDKEGNRFRCEVANGVTKYLFFCFDCYKAAAAIAMSKHDRASKYNRRRNWGSDYNAFVNH